ncbi:MAG TPA: VWA domain-containing protein [Blastocatellia bacterium]|nr:VWA domain-containing protein [Blastocatellia bacterium]
MSKRLILALSFVIAFFTTASSQQKTPVQKAPQKEDVVRISVTLVQVDVTVTDHKGRQVTDLKPEDFEIYEDGRPQRISAFSYELAEPKSETRVAVAAEAQPPNVNAPHINAPPLPPTRLKPADVRRTIALVVDDLTLSFQSAYHVRSALKKFVAEQMEPGDLVAIIRTGAGMGALQQFTNDKRQLYAAIERVRWNPAGSGQIGAFALIDTDTPRTPELDQIREDIFSVGTLGALNFIVRGLDELPGRKSIILFSDGITIHNHDASSRVLDSVRRLVDLANRASVVVYTIDPRGLQYLGLTAADHVCST